MGEAVSPFMKRGLRGLKWFHVVTDSYGLVCPVGETVRVAAVAEADREPEFGDLCTYLFDEPGWC